MLTSPPVSTVCRLLIVLSLAVPQAVAGQTANADQPQDAGQQTPAPGADEEADHDALRELRRVYEQSVNENRIDLLAPHLHPDFYGIMITGAGVGSLEEMREFWRGLRELIGEGGRYTTTLNPERSVIAGDLALARGTTDDVVVTGEGREYRFSTSWMAVLQRVDGQWKVLRAQGTMDPVSNAFVTAFTRRAVLQGTLLGVLGGIVLGWLFAVVYRRIRMRRA